MERTASGRAQLTSFVASATERGIADTTIVGVLKASGWSETDIYGALREAYGLSVPVRRGFAGGARDAFLYLLSFGTLSAWIVALGSLFFGAIERTWPDPVMNADRYGAAQDLASLLVGFPVYLVTMRFISRMLREDPEDTESPVRKWLTYFALLIAASLVIGDLITFLAYLLRGEITVRFLMKVVVVLVLAGSVFWYYLSSLKGSVPNKPFAAGAAVLVVSGLVLGFAGLGSPSYQRSLQADQVRVRHLRGIADEIRARGDHLPEALKDLRSEKVDPVTGLPYSYRRLGGTTYELCADFSAETHEGFWSHSAGRQCFLLDAARPLP